MNHRNSQPRFYDADYVYFITVNTQDKYPYFKEVILCDLWIEELKFCKKIREFDLYAFCLNYDHFHMILKPHENSNISKTMQSIKCYFSQDANKIISGVRFDESESSSSRFQVGENEEVNEKIKMRKNFEKKVLIPLQKKFHQKHPNAQHFIPKFKWQKSFRDHVIRNDQDMEIKWNYTTYNFKKHEYIPIRHRNEQLLNALYLCQSESGFAI